MHILYVRKIYSAGEAVRTQVPAYLTSAIVLERYRQYLKQQKQLITPIGIYAIDTSSTVQIYIYIPTKLFTAVLFAVGKH